MRDVGVLVVGHGSRDPEANVEFEALLERYRTDRPDLEIDPAYVELARPALEPALADMAGRARTVVVVPLFLFAAGHVKNDIPIALARARRERPSTRLVAARPLGVHPLLAEMAFARAEMVLPPEAERPRTAVVVVGRGASDPDANGDFCKLVRLFGEGRGLGLVLPAFIGITRPSVAEALELAGRSRPARIAVVPYFLFGGRLIRKLDETVAAFRAGQPWIDVQVAPHLGGDRRLHALLDERIEDALEGGRPLPCDTCQYRTPIGAVAENVGGLKALLWSVRHGFTHTQAMPHVHAHRPLTRHVLVCGNADCAAAGSVEVIDRLRRLLKARGRQLDIRVTRTSCMGRCGEGPTVAVYPDGIWYRRVGAADAEALVEEHLLEGRLVARLVGEIMQ